MDNFQDSNDFFLTSLVNIYKDPINSCCVKLLTEKLLITRQTKMAAGSSLPCIACRHAHSVVSAFCSADSTPL